MGSVSVQVLKGYVQRNIMTAPRQLVGAQWHFYYFFLAQHMNYLSIKMILEAMTYFRLGLLDKANKPRV